MACPTSALVQSEHSPPRMHVPITAQVALNIIMAEPQKKAATVDEDTAATGGEGPAQGSVSVVLHVSVCLQMLPTR